MRYSKEETQQAIRALRKLLRPGQRVFCVLRHCARSGMSRSISLYAIKKGDLVNLNGYAGRVLDRTLDNKNGGVKIGGCGMDMGFALVYELGEAIWPKGTPKPHSTRNGLPDTRGGYALHSSWL